MDPTTVALLLLLCSTLSCASTASAGLGAFGYPDDEHVIITHYGPVRYEPMTADQMDRPYDGGAAAAGAPSAARGYYKAEVIPLDMNTWKPVPGGWTGRGPVVGGGGGTGRVDALDVPLTVGYSVRPAKPLRRRRHDYFLATAGARGHRPQPPHGRRNRRPGAPTQPVAVEAGLWRF